MVFRTDVQVRGFDGGGRHGEVYTLAANRVLTLL